MKCLACLLLAGCANMPNPNDPAFANAIRLLNTKKSDPAAYGAPLGSNGVFKGDRVDGFNRICFYDRMGMAYVITIPSTQFCPL